MILFVILLIVGCILAILMFIDGITNEQLEIAFRNVGVKERMTFKSNEM